MLELIEIAKYTPTGTSRNTTSRALDRATPTTTPAAPAPPKSKTPAST